MKKQSQEDYIDLKQILSRFISKWHIFAIALVICIALAFLYIKSSPPVYKVSSSLKMKTEVTKAEKILDPVDVKDKNVNIEDEILVIKSTNYIRETINKLDFAISYFTKDLLVTEERYKLNYPVLIRIDSSVSQISGIPIFINILSDQEFELTVKGEEVVQYDFENDRVVQKIPNIDFTKRYRFDQPIKENLFGFTVTLTGNPNMYGSSELFFQINNPVSLTERYLNKLNIEVASRESNILLLSTEGTVVPKEKTFLDTLMYYVKQKDLDEKNIAGIKTIEFINYQLADVSESLNAAEQDLESFQYSTSNIGESGALYQRRDQLESEIADLNVKLNYLRNILNNLESLESVSKISAPISVGIDDPILSNLLVKLTDLNQQRIQVGRTATEANPVIQRIDLDIRTTKNALRDNLTGAINTTNIKINDINSRIAQTNQSINRLPSASIRRLGIERRFEFTDNTYELFQQRKAAAAIALATNESDWAIVESARMDGNSPVSPKKKFILLLALFMGLIIPAVIILAKDYFDNTIKGKAELEKYTNIPLIGTVAKGNKNIKLASDYDSRSLLLESLRDIRLNLQFFTSNNEHKVIGFTSSASGEGKTFCSVNLGIVLAQSGKRVLIVDSDMRKSNMQSFFEVSTRQGLSTYLIGNSDIQNIVQPTRVRNVDVIISGPFPPNPFDLISLPRFGDLINRFKEMYDYIIIDAPPLGLVSEYLLIANHTDINIYVARHHYTKRDYLDKVNELYESQKIKNLGIILNDMKVSQIYGGLSKSPSNDKYVSSNLTPKKGKILQKKSKAASHSPAPQQG
mgnify:CR=1 FL=1